MSKYRKGDVYRNAGTNSAVEITGVERSTHGNTSKIDLNLWVNGNSVGPRRMTTSRVTALVKHFGMVKKDG
jgi:hypothetical protein